MHPPVAQDAASPLRRALTVLGVVVAAVAVVAAGLAGWFGVERFVLAGAGETAGSGAVGDGLPTERLDPPLERWRRFDFTQRFTDREHRVAIDLDAREMRFQVIDAGVGYDFVARGEVGHDRSDAGWVALTPDEAVAHSELFAQQDIGPYLLTDILPPSAVPHTTLLSDTMEGELRVLDVAIDSASFRLADPLGHDRWLAASGEAADGPARRVVHVRPDGYVVRIDRTGSTRTWTEIAEPIMTGSPLEEPLDAATG